VLLYALTLLLRLASLEASAAASPNRAWVAVAAHALVGAAAVIRLTSEHWADASARTREAARLLGAGRWRRVWLSPLRAVVPATIGAAVLVFGYALFEAVIAEDYAGSPSHPFAGPFGHGDAAWFAIVSMSALLTGLVYLVYARMRPRGLPVPVEARVRPHLVVLVLACVPLLVMLVAALLPLAALLAAARDVPAAAWRLQVEVPGGRQSFALIRPLLWTFGYVVGIALLAPLLALPFAVALPRVRWPRGAAGMLPVAIAWYWLLLAPWDAVWHDFHLLVVGQPLRWLGGWTPSSVLGLVGVAVALAIPVLRRGPSRGDIEARRLLGAPALAARSAPGAWVRSIARAVAFGALVVLLADQLAFYRPNPDVPFPAPVQSFVWVSPDQRAPLALPAVLALLVASLAAYGVLEWLRYREPSGAR
jgi:ABC-type glycerol-3-phosphate transport system permease component